MKKIGKTITSDTMCYWFMVLPAIILIFMFNTMTWSGLLAAFQDFIPIKGVLGSEWIGLRNFDIFFKQPDSWQILRNTVVIAVGKIVASLIVQLVFALMLNEVRNTKLKRFIQTFTYLPHFVSWVIFATILKEFLNMNGVINSILNALGMESYMFLGDPSIFQGLMIGTDVLKEFGWGAVIYLSAFAAIDPGLYEAAELDGAGRWKQTLHVTIPSIRYVIVINCVLALGSVLNAGFDQIFNMYNTLVMSTADIIDTWVYRQGIGSMNYGLATAIGLFKSVIGMILTVIAYWAADKFADYKIF